MERVECRYNPGVGCADPSKCAICGWNPEKASLRIQEMKEADARRRKPVTTYFQRITTSKETLAAFLSWLQPSSGGMPDQQAGETLAGLRDKVFRRKFCTKCRAPSCGRCPHEEKRRDWVWFLEQRVGDDGNDPLW